MEYHDGCALPPALRDVEEVPAPPGLAAIVDEAEADLAAGRTYHFESDEEFEAWLDSIPYLPHAC